ncbi:hypothetical protein SBA3_960021 [Candidatus Sulfopaludibacter sp. SbA3]|nr:hypothetical protein SBA3_960021 [Candidatus Sulfopaludibacter sp. SbA3]
MWSGLPGTEIRLILLLALIAAEYHGQVTFGGLPLPGVTITATQGEKVIAAVTDQQGAYSFADLPDGAWSLQVEKAGFSTGKHDVTVGGGLTGPPFELMMLALDQMLKTPAARPLTISHRRSPTNSLSALRMDSSLTAARSTEPPRASPRRARSVTPAGVARVCTRMRSRW